jgi:hypothetical protein
VRGRAHDGTELRGDHRLHPAGDGEDFLGFDPVKTLVYAGIVQGFSTPPPLLLIMLTPSCRASFGNRSCEASYRIPFEE